MITSSAQKSDVNELVAYLAYGIRPEYDQVFDWTGPDDGTQIRFNSSTMYRLIFSGRAKFELIRYPLTEEYYQFVLSSRGIEEPKVQRLDGYDLDYPVLICIMDDGTNLTIDGHHRMVARYRLGYKDQVAFLIPPDSWKKCVMPQMVMPV